MKRLLSALMLVVMLAAMVAGCAAPPPAAQSPATPVVVEKTVVVKEIVTAPPQPTSPPQVVEQTVVVQQVVTPTPAPKSKDAKTILRVGTGDSGDGLTPHQTIIANFEKDNPDILVQLEAVAGNDYYTRLLTQMAAGDCPDIMQVGDDAVPMFVDKGAFLPLDDFIKGPNPLDTGIYLPGLMTPGQYQGKTWLLPKDFSTLAVYYNKKLFDKAGVKYPTDNWTWDEFVKTSQALTKGGTWGTQLTANWTTGFEYYVATFGGKLISDDGKKFVGYMDSPETIAAVQAFADMYNKYKVAPPAADLNLWAGGNTEFENGKAAMRLFGRWPLSGLKKDPNVDLGIVQVPAAKEKANVLFWGGFGICSKTKHPEEAWRFLRYYVGEPGSSVFKDWGLPAVKSVAEKAGLDKDPLEGPWIRGLADLKPRAYAFTPYWGETADPALNKALQTVLIDTQADVAATMKTAAQEAQAALDKKLAQQ